MTSATGYPKGLRALILTFLLLTLSACSPSSVTLSELVDQQEDYLGDGVTVVGSVVSFEGPDGVSYVLEDAEQNRVLLLPEDVVEPHLGQHVEITGTFDFDPNQGRVLQVEAIE